MSKFVCNQKAKGFVRDFYSNLKGAWVVKVIYIHPLLIYNIIFCNFGMLGCTRLKEVYFTLKRKKRLGTKGVLLNQQERTHSNWSTFVLKHKNQP